MARIFQRYTEQARRTIFFARVEAIVRNSKTIEATHILAGLTWDADTRVERIACLKSRAVEIHALARLPHLPSSLVGYTPDCEIPLDNDAKMTLAYASEEADRDREFWIDTDHLLRGLMRFRNDVEAALTKEGFRLEDLRAKSVSSRLENPSPPAPRKEAVFLALRRYRILVLLMLLALLMVFLRWMGPVA